MKECTRITKKEIAQFHTDTLRVVSVRDVESRAADWWSEAPAKAEFEAFRAGIVKQPSARAAQPREADLNFDPSPSDLEGDMEKVEQAAKEDRRAAHGDLSTKLAKLKAEATPAGDGPRRKRRSSASARPAGKTRTQPRQSSLREKQRDEGEGPHRPKKARVNIDSSPVWFGRPEVPAEAEEAEESYYSESLEEQKKPPTGEKKRKANKGKKDEKGRRKRKADRGPFGSGRKVSYRKEDDDDLRSDEEEGSESSSFQAGVPEKRSHQLVLMEYADQKPGRLAARLLQKMALLSSRTGTPMSSVLAASRNKTPPSAVQYYMTVLYPQHKEKMTLRLQRELRTLAQGLDFLSLGDIERCADLLSQRMKALEMTVHDQNWARAQFLELIPLESAGLADAEEQRMATKEQVLEAKMRKAVNAPRGGGKGSTPAPDGEKGEGIRGRWKGGKRGDKGRGKGAPNEAAPAKTPVA